MLKIDDNVVKITFQQDAAPSHGCGDVRNYFVATYTGRRIGWRSRIQRPARLSDLSPLELQTSKTARKI